MYPHRSGDVVEIAGTMSGGGGRAQQGRMGRQVRVDTTRDMGKEMAAAERKLEQDQRRLEQCRTELHQLTVKVTQLQTDFERTTDSIENLSTQITDGEKRLTALDKRFTDQAESLNAVKVDEEARATVRRRVEQCTRLRDAAVTTAQEQREKVQTVAAEIQAIWDRLEKKRMKKFMDGFIKIGQALKEMYQMITLGGDALLDLDDSLNPFSEGISFGVRPPKKSWKQIASLSGGEKTLSSLALVFALHSYKPTPLYVIDEIDAALDFRNVSIIAHYVKGRTRNAQFIIISLRNDMFELGDRLVGTCQTHDCTYNVVIDPGRICLGVDENERPADTAHSSQNSAANEENVANVSRQSGDALVI